ncbi:MAG: TRAP transporter large permease [Desulfobacterales bacterium]|nr:TRAP transporter large permease [Desulfobacterales bacterium]
MSAFFLMFVIIIILILIEVPVGYCFGIGALSYGFMSGTNISFHATYGFSVIGSFALLAIPLFVLSGTLMGTGGLSERILNFVNSFVGRRKGGLGAVTVISCAIFGAISGSAAAAIAAIGKIMIPRMVDEGYPEGHATGLVAVSSVLALMIPPSIPMIVFAIATRQSVAKVFLATMLPGIMLAVVYCILNYIFLRNNNTIKVAPQLSYPDAAKEVLRTGKEGIFALFMPIIVLGGIYSGICTATEAGAVAFIYTLVIGFFVYKGLTLRNLFDSTMDAATLTGSVVMLLFFLYMMSRGMVLAQIPSQFADLLLSLSDNKIVLLLIINVLLLFMGMIIDDVAGGVLAAIILMPVIQKIGVDPVHFAAIVGTNLGLGNITPPCAPLLYMAGGVSKLPLEKYIAPTMKFLVFGHVPMVLVVTCVPEFSMFLPNLYAN